MDDQNYKAIIESILFTMGESVELSKIAAAIELDKEKTKQLLDELIEDYANAKSQIAQLKKIFPNSSEAKTCGALESTITAKEEAKKAEQERIKALGFKGFLGI